MSGTSSSSDEVTIHESGVVVRSSGGAHTSGADDVPAIADDDTTVSPKVVKPPADTEETSSRQRRDSRITAPPVAAVHTRAQRQNISDTTDVAPTARSSGVAADTHLSGASVVDDRVLDSVDQPSAAMFSAMAPTSVAPDPIVAVAAIPKTVIEMATGLISAFLAPGPGTAPESPTLWGLLAWARQQFAQAFTRQNSASAVGQTTQVDPPPEDPQADELADAEVDAVAAADIEGLNPDYERTTIVSGLNQPTRFPLPT